MMERATTGVTWNHQSIIDILKSSNSGLCVIPSAIFSVMLENMSLLSKSIESITKSLTAVVCKPPNDPATDISNADILSRLDNLTDMIKSTTFAFMEDDEVRTLQQDLKFRSALFQKQLHAEKVSKLYEELLSDDVPYALAKFRTKVSPSEKEWVKEIQREATIFTVESEIKIREGYISDWKEQISNLDKKRDTFLATNPEYRDRFQRRIEQDEKKSVKSVERAIFKLQNSCDLEKRTSQSSEFLLSTPTKRSKRLRSGRRHTTGEEPPTPNHGSELI
jgi:hypothetical protein